MLIRLGRDLFKIQSTRIWQFLGIGVLVGLHWLTFFGSIKMSNASICLVALATTSFFTSLIEPLVLRSRIKGLEIGLGLLIVPGMILVVNNTELHMLPGIWLGLISAALAALFGSLNKKLIKTADPLSITFLEMTGAWISISLVLPFALPRLDAVEFWPVPRDWIYLVILALICTTFAYVLVLRTLRFLSAYAANLVVNLEPVYGMVLAALLLKENQELSTGFYLGSAMIILVILIYPFLKRRRDNSEMQQRGLTR